MVGEKAVNGFMIMQHVKNVLTGKTFGWQPVYDLGSAILIWGLVLVVSPISNRPASQSLVYLAVGVLSFVWVLGIKSVYRRAPALARTEEISRVVQAVAWSAGAVTMAALFTNWILGATEVLLGSIALLILRIMVRGARKQLSEETMIKRGSERVTIVGVGTEAKELVQVIRDHSELRLELCGVVGNLAVAERYGIADEWIGPTNRLIEIMNRYQIDSAIITATGFRGEKMKEITTDLFSAGFDVHLTTGIGHLWEGRFQVQSLVHEPFITIQRNQPKPWQRKAKRALDIVGASVALTLASPVMLGAAAAIYYQDRGPVFYKSKRIGLESGEFKMVKFRSMTQNADALKKQMQAENERSGPLFKMSADPRITRIGKIIRETSIDELPQLFNVIKGDMSLVGPRPALPEENLAFDAELRKRTGVRPGITGLWQVEARSNAAFNAYRRLDLHYVENWTLWLDIRILLATVEQVATSLMFIPLRRFVKPSAKTDAISGATNERQALEPFLVEDVIDLRDDADVNAGEITSQSKSSN